MRISDWSSDVCSSESLTTWIGMVSSPVGAVGARAYRLRLLAGGHDLDPAVFRSRRIALVEQVAESLADGLQAPGVDAMLHQVIAHRARAPLREPLVVAGRAHAIGVADAGEAAILELRQIGSASCRERVCP